MTATASGALALLLVAASAADAAGTGAGIERLAGGRTIERPIARGERHRYRATLRAGQFLQVEIATRRATVQVRLEEIAERADSPPALRRSVLGGYPPFPAFWLASKDVEVELTLSSDGGTRGRYSLRTDVRAATAADSARMEYQALRSEGRRLRNARDTLPSAIEAYRGALAAAQEAAEPRLVSDALKWLAWAQQDHGDESAAAETLDALLRASAGQGGAVEAAALYNLGTHRLFRNDLQDALALFQRALPLARAAGAGSLEGSLLDHMGVVYARVGEQRRSLSLYRQALALVLQEGELGDEAGLRNKLGTALVKSGRRREALAELTIALRLRRELSDGRGEAVVRLELGRICREMGRYAEALRHLQRGLELKEAVGPSHTVVLLAESALVHEALGDAPMALQVTLEANALLPRVPPRSWQHWRIPAQVARLHRDAGRLPEARRWVESAAGAADEGWAALASDGLRNAYTAFTAEVIDLMVDVLMLLHERSPGEGLDRLALESSERGRARGLRELLREARVMLPHRLEDALLVRERALREEMSATAEKQRQLLREGREDAAAGRDLQVLTTEYDELRGRIRAADPRYAALTQAAPPSAADIQKLLEPGTAVLEYDLGGPRSYLWVITAEGISSHALPGDDVISPLARKLHDRLAARNRISPRESAAARRASLVRADREAAETAARLGALLLGPVPGLAALSRVVVVPDGVLHYVPFATLSVPGADGPLIARHEVVHLPSAAVAAMLRQQRGRAPASQEVAIFADPVFDARDPRLGQRAAASGSPPDDPAVLQDRVTMATVRLPRLEYTRALAQDIAAGLPDAARTVALDFDANREAVTGGRLERYRSLLFATHGILNSEYPELTGLALSMFDETGRARDGFLRLQDIYHLELNADLVVLGACETGLGQEVRGEGLVGLTGGFFYAGARRVLASLWRVDEQATVELIKELYRGIRKDGLSAAAALRQAQLRLRERPRFRSPYYWAGFVLQGDW